MARIPVALPKKKSWVAKKLSQFQIFLTKIEEKNPGVPKIFVENFQFFWQKFETKSGGSKSILVFFDKFRKKLGVTKIKEFLLFCVHWLKNKEIPFKWEMTEYDRHQKWPNMIDTKYYDRILTQNIDIGKEKLYISSDLDARRASLTLLSPRVKYCVRISFQ